MDIKIVPVTKPKQIDLSDLKFGESFTDRMFTFKYSPDKGWHDAAIELFHDLVLSPAATVFNYAQEIFEGCKVFKQPDSNVAFFRIKDNTARFNSSAERMCMPRLDEEFVMKALMELVRLEKAWVPSEPGTALYLRPVMIGTDPIIKLRGATNFLFYIIMSPVGPYFTTGFKCANIKVETSLVRAVLGGTGSVKTGGNYAASLKAGEQAISEGYQQVMWLDGIEHRYVEEVGAMNIFFVINDVVTTPALSGSILPGITRMSVLALAEKKGLKVEERRISIDEVISGIKSGCVQEVFGSGTAAVISPVGKLAYKGEEFTINNNNVGRVSQMLFDELTGIQQGRLSDPFEWRTVVK